MSNRRSSEQLPLLRTHANVVGDGLLTLATSKLGLNLVEPYDRFRWRQQIEGHPYHENTKVKETTNMVDLGSKRHLAGGGEGRLQFVCPSSGLLLYIAHVIYSSQVILNPYYVTR